MTTMILFMAAPAAAGSGPDIAVCDVNSLSQFGRTGDVGGGTVGLAFATTHFNAGNAGIAWSSLPATSHPLLTQNMYRLATLNGSTRFEQIGQSWVFNSYCPLQNGNCAACIPDDPCGPTLGPGCSTPHSAASHAGQTNLSSRGFVHPFTGIYPPTLNNHSGHVHSDGIAHRLQVDDADLVTPGAAFFVESQAIAVSDASAGNQFNNVGYRRALVSGPNGSGVFGFSFSGGTVQETPAIYAWSTAAFVSVDPTPGTDGRIVVAYEVTPLGGDLHHYEYAVYNMNNDAGVGAFEVNASPCHVGFHAVKNHAPQPNAPDYSNDPWDITLDGSSVRWATQPFADNPDANAIRWGTMYNFRFDARGLPVAGDATLTLFKTGQTVPVGVLVPGAPAALRADFDDDCAVTESDAPFFVDVLLTPDADPARADRADLDDSGAADARDVAAFIAALMEG